MYANFLDEIKHKTMDMVDYTFEFNLPPLDSDFQLVTNLIGGKAPQDYLSFLKQSDGVVLFYKNEVYGYKFYDCKSLIKENSFQKNNLLDDWDDNILLICSCMGTADYIGIKFVNDYKYEIVDCCGDYLPSEWETIADNLQEFIEKLIQNEGGIFWL